LPIDFEWNRFPLSRVRSTAHQEVLFPPGQATMLPHPVPAGRRLVALPSYLSEWFALSRPVATPSCIDLSILLFLNQTPQDSFTFPRQLVARIICAKGNGRRGTRARSARYPDSRTYVLRFDGDRNARQAKSPANRVLLPPASVSLAQCAQFRGVAFPSLMC
jgi:hypothetical protein